MVSSAKVCRNSLFSFKRNWPSSLRLEAVVKIAAFLMASFPRTRQIFVASDGVFVSEGFSVRWGLLMSGG
jgi:hypothetical protein